MATGTSIRAGAAYVELTVNNTLLVRGLKQAQNHLKAFSATVSSWGRELMKVSAIALTPIAIGAKTWADFDKQMAMVSTMLDEPQKHMARFSAGIRAMSVKFGEDTATLSKGLYDLLSSSIAPEHAMQVLDVAMRAAKGGMTDAATATQAIVNVLNAFHIPAERAEEVADALFVTVKRGVITFEEMAQTVGAVTATAATAGVSLDEVGAAIATMTRNGLKAEMSVVALQSVIKGFLKPSEKGAALAKQYGLELSMVGLKADGLLGVMRKLEAVPPDVIAEMFPDVRGLRGVFALRGDVQGLATDLDLMAKKSGAAQEAYSKMAGRLSSTFAQLWQSGKLLASVIGEAVAPKLQEWLRDILRLAAGAVRFISKNKELVVSVMKWAVIIGAAGAALVALGAAGQTVAFVIGGLVSIISGVTTAVTLLASTIGALAVWITTPVGAVIAIFGAFGATMLVVTGTVGKAMDWLRGIFSRLSEDAAATFQGIKDALIAGDFALAARILWLALKMEWQKGIYWLTEWWVAFKEVFVSVATEAFYGAVKVLAGAWDGLRALWVIIVGFLSNVWQSFTGGICKAWNATQGFLTKGFLKVMSLWDKNITDESYANIDRETQQKNSAIDTERQKSQQAYNDRLAQIGQDYEGTAAEIDKEKAQSHADRQNRYQAQLKAAQDERDQAEQEWKDAIAQAAKERKAVESAEQPEMPTLPAQKKIEASVPAMKVAQERQLEAKGTFSAVAMWGMGLGSTAERTAKAAEETAKNTKRIADDMEDSGMEFG